MILQRLFKRVQRLQIGTGIAQSHQQNRGCGYQTVSPDLQIVQPVLVEDKGLRIRLGPKNSRREKILTDERRKNLSQSMRSKQAMVNAFFEQVVMNFSYSTLAGMDSSVLI